MSQMQTHYRNEFNQKSERYEDGKYDDYEEDDIEDEVDDDEEKVEEPKLNMEELEFLKLREKLKEKFRQKLKKQSAHYFGHSSLTQDRKRTSTNDSFGSFFGPSQPVIASRVLDESRSIRETQHIASKVPRSSSEHGVSTFSSSERKVLEHQQTPNVNEVKKKAQALKDMRDYSFLFSDDADSPEKEPPVASQLASASKQVARSAQTPLESKVLANRPLKSVNNSHVKNTVPASRHVQTKLPSKVAQASRQIPSSAEPRKVPVRLASGNGPSRPVEPKPVQSKSKIPLQSKIDKQVLVTKRPNANGVNGVSSQKYQPTSKPYNSTQHHYVEQKRPSHAAGTIRAEPKPALKQAPQLKSQPSKLSSSRDIRDELPKKRPLKRRPDEDDEENAIQMIRSMFRYNPSKYSGMDDDDSDMEADFSQIEQEELRSAQIARKEDEEQLLLIEEEERRERMRKKQRLNRR